MTDRPVSIIPKTKDELERFYLDIFYRINGGGNASSFEDIETLIQFLANNDSTAEIAKLDLRVKDIETLIAMQNDYSGEMTRLKVKINDLEAQIAMQKDYAGEIERLKTKLEDLETQMALGG